MTRRSFSVAVGAAVSGMAVAAAADKKAKHDCKGMNACKGQGGCKSGDNGCAGKNSCKGKGGCAVPKKKSSLRLRHPPEHNA